MPRHGASCLENNVYSIRSQTWPPFDELKGEPLSSSDNHQEIPVVGRSVVTLDDLSTGQIRELLHKAEYIDAHRREVAHACDGRVIATLFYEPSTRTRLSFETAMLRLGGQVIGFAGSQLASVTKGESIADTLKTVSNYVDVVAIRHPKEGAALVAAEASSVPVINAGDGGHMHPTQTLADLSTIQARFGRVTGLTVGLCGDLTFGRTVHSLIETLCRFGDVRFVLVSPDELKCPQYVIDRIEATPSCSYVECRDLASVIGDLDVLYMTRVQKERFFNEDDYLRLRDTYILDESKLAAAKRDMAVLHPLPRVNEIAVEVDDDPRAAYFEQVKRGMLMRMALESSVIGDRLPGYEPLGAVDTLIDTDPASKEVQA
ncbi:aspartate carbamoyltransferase [Bifidobacterium pullorum subsp. saeculare]|uniref:Aspartate carbamoyltransferase n=1 Tax=Bifidobacterium pullorum subsp. saeculare TaxID=78257 RepID=A0A938WWX8_9BIFI|nr:aspartate carbamoyltransferase [Bifidobacterium pullorum subsp. saeculare]